MCQLLGPPNLHLVSEMRVVLWTALTLQLCSHFIITRMYTPQGQGSVLALSTNLSQTSRTVLTESSCSRNIVEWLKWMHSTGWHLPSLLFLLLNDTELYDLATLHHLVFHLHIYKIKKCKLDMSLLLIFLESGEGTFKEGFWLLWYLWKSHKSSGVKRRLAVPVIFVWLADMAIFLHIYIIMNGHPRIVANGQQDLYREFREKEADIGADLGMIMLLWHLNKCYYWERPLRNLPKEDECFGPLDSFKLSFFVHGV